MIIIPYPDSGARKVRERAAVLGMWTNNNGMVWKITANRTTLCYSSMAIEIHLYYRWYIYIYVYIYIYIVYIYILYILYIYRYPSSSGISRLGMLHDMLVACVSPWGAILESWSKFHGQTQDVYGGEHPLIQFFHYCSIRSSICYILMFLMFSKYVDSSMTFSPFSGSNWARHFIWIGHQRAIPVGCTHSIPAILTTCLKCQEQQKCCNMW